MTKAEEWAQENKELILACQNRSGIATLAFEAGYLAAQPKQETIPFATIIATMNQILNKQFKTGEATKKHIRARWNEGFREPDFEKVCRTKQQQWDSDPEMRIYLRPETLFGTKMDGYCNEVAKVNIIEPWM